MEQFKINRTSNKIGAMDNPKTPIEHVAGPQNRNIKKVVNPQGEGVLPKIKVSEPKSN